MKKYYALGVSGLIFGAAAVGYTLQASETTLAESGHSSQAVAGEGLQATGVAAPAAESGPQITVYKSPNCGCCKDWAKHLETHGFAVDVKSVDNLQAVKIENNVPREMASCHTALINGLVVEGHVPAADIKAYLDYRKSNFGDKTVGLSVPGMPHGTPGMETGRKDSFEVLAFTADGGSRAVKSYDSY